MAASLPRRNANILKVSGNTGAFDILRSQEGAQSPSTDGLAIPPHDAEALLPTILSGSGAGIDISGMPESGKTNVADLIFVAHVSAGGQGFYFQPHGAKKLKRMILDLPARVRDKILVITASDPTTAVPVNPLNVPRSGISEYEAAAKLSNKVGHTARILLSSSGEGALGFAGRPLLRKWVVRWLRTLAQMGLTIPDVKMFIDTRNPVYLRLCELVPDVMARHEMEGLAERNSSERDEILAATNRFLALLENPFTEAMLGKIGDGVLDMRELIAQGYSIVFDLAPEGNLSDDDQQVIGNIYLMELIHCLMNLPEHLRLGERCLVQIDEVALFEVSAPLLLRCLCEIRKFGRLSLCHQGSCRFPGGQDNEFLKAMMKMTRVHIYFRHTGDDAHLFSADFALASYDPKSVKFTMTQLQEYHDGHEIIDLYGESVGNTEGETMGGAEKTGESTSDNWSNTDNASHSESVSRREQQDLALRDIITRAKADVRGTSAAKGGANSRSQEHSKNWSRNASRSHTVTRSQTIVPIIRTREIITSITTYTPEEHDRQGARTLSSLDTGEAIFHVPGKCLYRVKFPLAQDALSRTPKTLRKLEAEYDEYLRSLPFFHRPEDILQEREQFVAALLCNIHQVQQALPRGRNAVVTLAAPAGGPLSVLRSTNDPQNTPLEI